MPHLSSTIFDLIHGLQHYLSHQREYPDSDTAQKAQLIQCIYRLTHQDLLTPLPSGENIFIHFILVLHRNSMLNTAQPIFLALMERSASFRAQYSATLDATMFLLTSSNQNKQTVFQRIDALRNKQFLDFYLEQIKRYLSKPFLLYTSLTHRYPKDLLEQDVRNNKSTLWRCPLSMSALFFEELKHKGFRLLDNLVLPFISSEHFIAALDVLRAALIGKKIPIFTYKNLLLEHPKPHHSLLHELVMAGDVYKFKAYLYAIDTMHREHIITTEEYKHIFQATNLAGYAALHQAINAVNLVIAQVVLSYLNTQCSLPRLERKSLLESHTSIQKKGILYQSNKRHHAGAEEINTTIKHLLEVWSSEEHRPCLYKHGFFARAPGAELTSDLSSAKPEEHWNPWQSPLLWSPN